MRVRLSPVLLLLLAPGCVFYAGDDDDDPCQYGGGDVDTGGAAPDDAYDPGLRNPDTGECVYYGGGGGGGGGGCDACGNCPPAGDPGTGADEAQPEPLPTWGTCEGQCTGLDEATCAATSACRVIYVGGGDALTFADCWAVDQSGPVQGGGCEGLDATTCSMHDDCSAVHQPACPDEGDAAGIEAPEPVDCTTPGAFGFCIAEGDTGGPGECEGEVTCDGLLPDCPEGTTPGIADGCYTGYCIPLEDCDDAPACAELADESSCVERADCVPIYEGVDCECDDVDCTCADWVYASCE